MSLTTSANSDCFITSHIYSCNSQLLSPNTKYVVQIPGWCKVYIAMHFALNIMVCDMYTSKYEVSIEIKLYSIVYCVLFKAVCSSYVAWKLYFSTFRYLCRGPSVIEPLSQSTIILFNTTA